MQHISFSENQSPFSIAKLLRSDSWLVPYLYAKTYNMRLRLSS